MKQTIFSLLMALLPLAAAADAVEVGGIYYNLNFNEKVAELTKRPSGLYTGVIEIPASVEYEGDAYAVTSIGNQAFCGCTF